MKNFKFPLVIAALVAVSLIAWSPTGTNATGIGVRTFARQTASLPVTSSTTLVNTDLTFNLAANAKVHVTYYVPVTLAGTASGLKFLVDAPASVVDYNSSCVVFADDATLALVSVITSEAAQGVTLANAGNHIVQIDFDLFNGATAGTVTLQFAQNVSDAGAATVLKGAYAEIVKL